MATRKNARMRCTAILPDLLPALDQAVATRNALAHEFFWPRNESEDSPHLEAAQQRLVAAASLFRNVSDSLETVVDAVLTRLHADSDAANEKAAAALAQPL